MIVVYFWLFLMYFCQFFHDPTIIDLNIFYKYLDFVPYNKSFKKLNSSIFHTNAIPFVVTFPNNAEYV